MWKMVRYSKSYALMYNGHVIVIGRPGQSAARALIDFGIIVANEMQATPA